MLNLLNLVPLWVLDGAGATAALDKTERWALLGVTVLLAPVMGEWTFLLVAGAIGYRLTTKDFPPGGEPRHADLFCKCAGAVRRGSAIFARVGI